MNYDDIIDGMNMAREDGLQPTQVHLGFEETRSLMEDANFNRASGGTVGSPQMGQVAGLDVQQANADGMRLMLAQHDDHVQYYIF